MRLLPAADADLATRLRALYLLGAAAIVLVAGALLLAIAGHAARGHGPVANKAFLDGTTAEVVGQITAAVKAVYSYDYTVLDANEAAAKGVITGPFAQRFDQVFAPVKLLAPKEKVALTTTVPAAGVLQLAEDRARLLMMVDQGGTKNGTQPVAGATARLIVEAQLVDGRWKIAEVTPE